jgi:mycofactocin system creatininase family protein
VIHDLAERAWPTIGQAPLVLIPTGSTEQHGPHLPFDTDTVIATAVARGLAEGLDGAVVVAPAIAYGSSGEHQGFPGTASIGQEALRSVIVELVRSVSNWAGRIVFVNAHGGNIRALSDAVVLLVREQHDVAWLPCAVTGADAHAGRTETSLMLALAPDVVRMDLAERGTTDGIAQLAERLASDGVRSVSANGILGDPVGATASEGFDLLQLMIEGASRRMRASTTDAWGCLKDPEPA